MIWYREVDNIITKGIEDRHEMLDLISKTDKDLKAFLDRSESFPGIRRGVGSGLEGFLQLVNEEKNSGRLSL